MNIKFLTSLSLLFFAFQIFGQSEIRTFSIEEAINYAYEKSSAIRSGQLDITDAEARIVENRAIGIPTLSLGLNYSNYIKLPTSLIPAQFINPSAPEGEFAELQFGTKHNFTGSIDLEWLTLDGSYFIGLKAAKVYRQFTQDKFVAIRQEVKNNVTQAYLPPLIIRENLAILDKNIANLEKLIYESKALYKEGFIEQLDVDRLELSLANLKVERENLSRQNETALNYLKFTIGYPVDRELDVLDDIESLFSPAGQEELRAPIDYKSRPEYVAANTGIYLNELNVRRLRSMYYPSLRLFGSYQRSVEGNDLNNTFDIPTFVIGGAVSVPLFDGLEKRGMIQRAKISLELARLQKNDLERAISLEVQNARVAYINARNRADNQKKTLELAQKIYDTTRIKYREGIGSSLELTTAERELYEAQRNHTQALYDLLVAKTNLDKALGK